MPRVKLAETAISPAERTRRIILSAMGRCGINQKIVAEKLGVTPSCLSQKMTQGRWNLCDIQKLHRILSFTQDEALALLGVKKSTPGGAA